mmetsp:Transcript_4332/g.10262  ORF Transcript_4332/g.10262 Transcript_4332/m.10262 type:complete len:702 (+) Transcript_4332:145-2250(+)
METKVQSPTAADADVEIGLPDRKMHSKAMVDALGAPPGWSEGQAFDPEHMKHFLKEMVSQNEKILAEMDSETQVPRAPLAWANTGLSWKNVNYKASDSKGNEKVILQNVWGNVEPGTLVALMGPSGCGKSTLLDILAQKKTTPFEGEIFCNGHKVTNDRFFKRYATYVPQADLMHESLTVHETVAADGALKNPPPRSVEQDPEVRSLTLDMYLSALGLYHVKDSLIGGQHRRGVSGGQKRRVTLARGLVAGAQLMFADEPTSGLSATDAETCVKVLKFLTRRVGLTCIVVIHQPRIEVAELFDQLIMLTANPMAYGGSTVYNGPMSAALEYCQQVGYPVPDRANIVDWMMDVISPGYKHIMVKQGKKAVDESVKDFVMYFKAKVLPKLQEDVATMTATQGMHPKDLAVNKWEKAGSMASAEMSKHFPVSRPNSVNSTGPWRQMQILFWVKMKLLQRDVKGLKMRLMMSVLQSCILGVAFYDIASSAELMHMQFLFLVMQMVAMGGMQVMPALVDARTIMKKETGEALYGVGPWITVMAIVDGLVTLISSSTFVVITYAFGGMEWSNFPAFYLSLVMLVLVMDSYFSLIAAVAHTGEMAQVTAMPFLIMFMIYNGFLVTRATVPDFMTWALYCSPFYYCISNLARDLYENVPDCPGCQVVIETYGFDEAPSKAFGYIFLAAMFLLFRFLQIVALIKLNNPKN